MKTVVRQILLNRFWSIADIPAKSIWLDSYDTSTVITSGSNVTQWNDKSSEANNFLPVASAFPTTSNALGYQAIAFPSTDNRLVSVKATGLDLSSTSYSIFAVASIASSNAGGFNGIISNRTGAANWITLGTGTSGFITYENRGTAANVVTSYSPFAQGLQIYSLIKTNSLFSMYRNGVLFSSTAGNVGDGGISQVWTLGNWSGADQGLNGLMTNILVLPNASSDAERQRIEGVFAFQNNIRVKLSDTHPYKYRRP